MEGVIRQLYDYDGSNLFPRTRPDAFVSSLQDSNAEGIRTIGELVDSSTPEYEPEFIYRVNGTWEGIPTDSSGQMYAAKISEIPGLHLGSVLSADLHVTNTVGQAVSGHTYPAGTLLEDIIRDMLTAGLTIPDVVATLVNAEFINVMVNNSPIANNGNMNMGDGDSLIITYGANFADGSFGPGENYDTSVFDSLHGSQSTFDAEEHRLYAGAYPVFMEVMRDSSLIYTATSDELNRLLSTGTVNFSDLTLTVTSGTSTFVLVIQYTGQADGVTPYRSDGMPSTASIGSGSTTYRFTITSTTAYDVTASVPRCEDDFRPAPFAVDVYDKNYVLSDYNANFILKSGYDVSVGGDSSTGVWSGDSVALYTKKSLFPDWELLDEGTGNPARYEKHDHTYVSVYSPVVSYDDGKFTKEAGYPLATFNSNNPKSVDSYLYAGCLLQNNPTMSIYRGASSVYSGALGYGTKATKTLVDWTRNWDNSEQIDFGYIITFNDANSGVINTGNTTLSTGNNYKLRLSVPYTANTITPVKSNGHDSSVTITAGNLIVESGTFEVKQEVDVSTDKPFYTIEYITINNNNYYNGDTVPYNSHSSDFTRNATVHFSYTDGNFKPGNSTYTDEEFNANHGVQNARLAAGCPRTGVVILRANNSSVGNTGAGSTTIDVSVIAAWSGTTVTFVTQGSYGDSTANAYKRSSRPSNVHIDAVSNSAMSNEFKLTFDGTLSKGVTAVTNGNGAVRINSGAWSGTTAGSSVTASVVPGNNVTVEANALNGYTFAGWSSDDAALVPDSSSNPYTFTMPNGNIAMRATFATSSDEYHFVMATTTDSNISGTTYSNVEQLINTSGNTVHFNTTTSSLPPTYSDATGYNGVGAGRKVFVIAAPVDYKSAKVYSTGGMDQQLEFTLEPIASSDNGIPYSSSSTDNVKYRLFKYKWYTPSGLVAERVELSKQA